MKVTATGEVCDRHETAAARWEFHRVRFDRKAGKVARQIVTLCNHCARSNYDALIEQGFLPVREGILVTA